jgi:hypothetical protein
MPAGYSGPLTGEDAMTAALSGCLKLVGCIILALVVIVWLIVR